MVLTRFAQQTAERNKKTRKNEKEPCPMERFPSHRGHMQKLNNISQCHLPRRTSVQARSTSSAECKTCHKPRQSVDCRLKVPGMKSPQTVTDRATNVQTAAATEPMDDDSFASLEVVRELAVVVTTVVLPPVSVEATVLVTLVTSIPRLV